MLEQHCRLKDLQESGIAESYNQAKNLEENEGFPRGKLLGPNTRVWSVSEVNEWLKNRPTGRSALVLARAAKSVEVRRTRRALRSTPDTRGASRQL